MAASVSNDGPYISRTLFVDPVPTQVRDARRAETEARILFAWRAGISGTRRQRGERL